MPSHLVATPESLEAIRASLVPEVAHRAFDDLTQLGRYTVSTIHGGEFAGPRGYPLEITGVATLTPVEGGLVSVVQEPIGISNESFVRTILGHMHHQLDPKREVKIGPQDYTKMLDALCRGGFNLAAYACFAGDGGNVGKLFVPSALERMFPIPKFDIRRPNSRPMSPPPATIARWIAAGSLIMALEDPDSEDFDQA